MDAIRGSGQQIVDGAVFRGRSGEATEGGTLPAGSVPYPPVDRGDQGISPSERQAAERFTAAVLQTPDVAMVLSYDAGTSEYQVRGPEGSFAFRRYRTPEGELDFQVTSVVGTQPVPSLDPRLLQTLDEQIAAAGGEPGTPVATDNTSYPDFFRRVSQLFDHARAPDLAVVPAPGTGKHNGTHGTPDVVQSRAPLVIAGPGVQRGAVTDAIASLEDIAPTVAEYLGVTPVQGTGPGGEQRTQSLKWQDGESLAPAIRQAEDGTTTFGTAQRAVVVVLDGATNAVLQDELAKGTMPNLQRLAARGTTFSNGAMSEYPSVTWSNHNVIVTGAAPGHNGIVGNAWYERETGKKPYPLHRPIHTSHLLDEDVETLYEAVDRSFDDAEGATVALNQPAGRGADVSTLDLHGLGKLPGGPGGVFTLGWNMLKGTMQLNPSRLREIFYIGMYSADNGAASGVVNLLQRDRAPKLAVLDLAQADHDGHLHGPQSDQYRMSLQDLDTHLGRIVDEIDRQGMTDDTMIVVTADHGQESVSHAPELQARWMDAARAAGVAAIDADRGIYLRTLDVDVERAGDSQLDVTVHDDDLDPGGVPRPIKRARVSVLDGDGHRVSRDRTDAQGHASVSTEDADAGSAVVVSRRGLTSEVRLLDMLE